MFATEYGILQGDYKGVFSPSSTRQENRSLPNNWP